MHTKSLFFASAEEHQSPEEIFRYRTFYGREFTSLGFQVLDPTLGKDIDNISLEKLIEPDLALVDQSHIVVAYLPRPSDGSLREIQQAKKDKLLVFGFTDKGNLAPEETKPHLDYWFTDFIELKLVLSAFLSPPGHYFTTAHTNNVQGTVIIYGQDIHEVAPHHLYNLFRKIDGKKNIFSFCAEKSHIHELAQKLPTVLRLGKVNRVYVLTKDGSPHDIQIHTLIEEVGENMNFNGEINHYVIEKGKMHEISRKSVRKSRHLSEIEKTLENEIKNRKVAIILGSRKDEPTVVNSGLLKLLEDASIDYEYSIISSDRNPDNLREYCKNLSEEFAVIIAIAGLIPNLPLVVKSWKPNTPVISVPLIGEGYEPKDTLLASTSTPGERPIIILGIGKNGLEKAARTSLEILSINNERIRRILDKNNNVAEIQTKPLKKD